jgi:hypothetical protein
MIMGQDLCFAIGFNMDYEAATMKWNDMTVAMKDDEFPTSYKNADPSKRSGRFSLGWKN